MEPKDNQKINKMIAEVLHMLKSRYYVVSSYHHKGIEIFVAEPESVLLQNQYVKICRVVGVRIRPLNASPPEDILNDPRAKMLVEKVGKPPATRLFQYTFVPLSIRLVRRLDTGAELYSVGEPVGNPITTYVVHAYYVVYRSRSGRIYDEEVRGGTKAYALLKRGELTWPQMVYIHKRDGHRTEIGVRIPIDKQVAQVISYLYSC